jgi:hypothetical protein
MSQPTYAYDEKDTGTPPEFIENSKGTLAYSGDDDSAEFAGINEKALIRKIDYRLVPWLALLYLLSFLDRTNIGNANLFGANARCRL